MLDPGDYKEIPGGPLTYEGLQGAPSAQCRPENHRWIFRGQKEAAWTFKSSLERVVYSYSETVERSGDRHVLERQALQKGLRSHLLASDVKRIPVKEIEGGLLRRFQRQCHQYIAQTPEKGDITEWLALMQHYGAPTRLLDWTWSFFVALFFAVREASGPCAVWALDLDAVDRVCIPKVTKLLEKDRNVQRAQTFEQLFQQERKCVVNLSSFRLNERLVVQQSTFLLPGDVGTPFDDNLAATLKRIRQSKVQAPALIKFTIDGTCRSRQRILQKLLRMNINAATLFPGLSGFAQSLEQTLSIPDVLRSSEKWGGRLQR